MSAILFYQADGILVKYEDVTSGCSSIDTVHDNVSQSPSNGPGKRQAPLTSTSNKYIGNAVSVIDFEKVRVRTKHFF